MKNHYFLTFFFFFALLITSLDSVAQGINNPVAQETIEGLTIYPNPVNSGKTFIYITSKKNISKKIEFFNVLGKKIRTTRLIGKQLDIANLNKGVYILKITEGDFSETRKLVIK